MPCKPLKEEIHHLACFSSFKYPAGMLLSRDKQCPPSRSNPPFFLPRVLGRLPLVPAGMLGRRASLLFPRYLLDCKAMIICPLFSPIRKMLQGKNRELLNPILRNVG